MTMTTILSIWGIYFIGVALNLYVYYDTDEGITEDRVYASLFSWVMFVLAVVLILFNYDGVNEKE